MDSSYPGLLADLADEQATLDGLLARTHPDRWSTPTPARGWDVSDTLWHLVVAEKAARASLVEDRDPLAEHPGHAYGPNPRQAPRELLASWRSARAETLDAFAHHDDGQRVPWGGRRMSVRSLATARLMECWAHGLDCFAALEEPAVDTDRLRHVAWLGWRTLAYAFALAGQPPTAPLEELRIELQAPSGGTWSFGPEGSQERVTGAAGVWCRVVTHRWRDASPPALCVSGQLAVQAVSVAQAFL
jgi:uncharacterized protein (TIGR03084 family)